MSDDTIITGPLYAKRKKLYPQAVHGPVRRIKWLVLALLMGGYCLLPLLRWDRGPNEPSQAVLLDLPARRFYFFFIELWPQEVFYFTGLLVLAAMTLFLMTAVAGRVWCGYMCPQTMWTDLFYAVERLVGGDRRERMQKDKQGWTTRRVWDLAATNFLWLLIAAATGIVWTLYFADAPTLLKEIFTLQASFYAYLWIGIFTFTTFIFAGYLREQLCIYMCPWPRIQAGLTDEWALNVTYRRDRGEPRMSVKKAEAAHKHNQAAGDCIDCYQCVHVCPTGVDIRDGAQLGCIQCGLCIDACNNIMKQINRPLGLIGYDNDVNIARHSQGKAPIYRLIRARTLLYAGVIALVSALMAYGLYNRPMVIISALHNRSPQYITLSDGSIRNDYILHVSNKNSEARQYEIKVDGLSNAKVSIAEKPVSADGRLIVEVGHDDVKEMRLLISTPAAQTPKERTPIVISAIDLTTGEKVSATDNFIPSKE